jgi:hypothetical protein
VQNAMSALPPIATSIAFFGMSALGQKRTPVSVCPLYVSRAVQSKTIDAATDHGIVQPLTIRLLGLNFVGGRIQRLVIVPKSRLLAR